MARDANSFTVSSRHHAGWSVVGMTGELDIATRPALRDRLNHVVATHRPPHVVVDLSGLDFCDASGLSAIVSGQRQIRQHRGQLRLVCPEGRIKRLLRLTGLIRTIEVYDSLAAATTPPGDGDHPVITALAG